MSNKKYNIKNLLKGRLGRRHYLIGLIILSFITGLISISVHDNYLNWLPALIGCILFLPITIKRLHDIDVSGGWALIRFLGFIDNLWVIAFIFNLVLIFKEGDKKENKYGDSPKGRSFIRAILK
jgi:uncharacterized membrane protein YhaH (DUF805 family)